MTTLERMIRHDAWTTRALLTVCAGLPDQQWTREFDIAHRSLSRTFAHLIANMECWHDLMAGQPQRARPGPSARRVDSPEAMIVRLDIVADELLALACAVELAGREDEDFTDYLDRPPTRKPLGAGLLHVATHGMHHRAQCLYMLRLLGVTHNIEGDALSFEFARRNLTRWPAPEQ